MDLAAIWWDLRRCAVSGRRVFSPDLVITIPARRCYPASLAAGDDAQWPTATSGQLDRGSASPRLQGWRHREHPSHSPGCQCPL